MSAFQKKSLSTDIPSRPGSSRSLYYSLLDGFAGNGLHVDIDAVIVESFLQEKISEARRIVVDFPHSLSQLESWTEQSFVATGQAYQQYLAERHAGAGRQYFPTKSHAIDFLVKSAPTKLVDGSWLHGLLSRWSEPLFSDLIRTYLEELGDGHPDQNHVALYRRLLAAQDCSDLDHLDDSYFLQGAIQLALAHQPGNLIPEIIGFNLGYEQLPLHLLITAYELRELGIDPYYFTLHITIDNFHNGHARRAIATAKAFAAMSDHPDDFFERLKNGYRLNFIGAGALEIVESFDLEREVRAVFTRKAAVGQYLHNDKCKVEGRTINEWLGLPEGIPELLAAFESSGWIKRNQDPANSRFWKLIEGDKPLMFGVFDTREKQIIHDWISGTWQAPRRPINTSPARELALVASGLPQRAARTKPHFTASTQPATLDRLIRDMSPALHDSEHGLGATRIFSEHFYTDRMSDVLSHRSGI